MGDLRYAQNKNCCVSAILTNPKLYPYARFVLIKSHLSLVQTCKILLHICRYLNSSLIGFFFIIVKNEPLMFGILIYICAN